MARKRKRRSGLGYGCPCATAKKSVVCRTVPLRKGSKQYKVVCRRADGKISSVNVYASRHERGKRLGARRAEQMRNLHRGRGRTKRLKG
jgi:hypothetical protein